MIFPALLHHLSDINGGVPRERAQVKTGGNFEERGMVPWCSDRSSAAFTEVGGRPRAEDGTTPGSGSRRSF